MRRPYVVWLRRADHLKKDRKLIREQYDSSNSSMKMLQGAPILIHCEGYVYEVCDLIKLCRPKDFDIVAKFINCVYRADKETDVPYIEFRIKQEIY